MNSTRASLILRLKNTEDVAAWDEFVAIYSPVIYRVSVSRGFQRADAENLIQEVLLAVAQAVPKWLERENRGSFRAWLLRITRNEAVDMLTRRATRPLGHGGESAERILLDLPAPNDLSVELDLEHKRTVFRWASAQVRDGMAQHTWDAFWLTSVEGLTVEEAAQRLDTRTGNIYFARSRVMTKIKEFVCQYETLS